MSRNSHTRFRFTGPLVALAAAFLALPIGEAGAQSIDELQAQIGAAQGEAEALGAEIDAKSAELAATQQQAAAAAAREAMLSAQLAQGQERAAELEVEVGAAKERLAEARDRLRRALTVLSERLVAIYTGDSPDATSLLLDSDGFEDMTTRAELLGRIEEADQSLAARVRDLRADVADELAAVEQARDDQLAYNDRITISRDQMAAARADAEAQAAALTEARATQQAAVVELQSRVDGWTAEVEEVQAAQAAAAAAAASAPAAEETVAGWVGEWAIPQSIVMCESGGDYSAVNPSSGAGGAYQILPSTWELYGGSGSPQDASRAEQNQIASQIWADSGAAAWECAG